MLYKLKAFPRNNMELLEMAAATNDEDTFLKAMHQIDWSRQSASEFARAVHLALAAGAHLAARNLAATGTQQYSDHPELKKMAHLLAPPRAVKTDLPPVPSLSANQAWLHTHADEYRGQWVALRNGELLAAAETAIGLKPCLERADDVMVTKVF